MLKLFSPAKINLYFQVKHKRLDGYHEIQSIYQAIDLGDTLTISHAAEDAITCTDPQVPTDRSNFVAKAVDLFRVKTGVQERFSVHIEKKIPLQSGLGGGSSNAATTLWGLNQLVGMSISSKTLTSWAGKLGADMSFFFSKGRALCTGYGEKITPIEGREIPEVWIAKPDYSLATPEVFRAVNVEQLPTRVAPANDGCPTRWNLFNDLEISAFELLPQLQDCKQQLKDLGFSQVHMTGSGTAFFCFGKPSTSLEIEGITFFKTQFLYRRSLDWYKFPQSSILAAHG